LQEGVGEIGHLPEETTNPAAVLTLVRGGEGGQSGGLLRFFEVPCKRDMSD